MSSMASRESKKNARRSAQSEHEGDHVLDLRGMIMPLTLLKITQRFRKIGDGETMAILGTDPDTRRDVLKVLETSPCEVLFIHDEKDYYLIRLRKKGGREV
jgi:TusA-related sulfurtransferase